MESPAPAPITAVPALTMQPEGIQLSVVKMTSLGLRSPKGWTGPDVVDGVHVGGTWRSHQVPLSHVKDNPDHLQLLEDWLRSYRPDELFDDDGPLPAGTPRQRGRTPADERDDARAVFEASDRGFAERVTPDDVGISREGRVTEVLSEHKCHGWLEGYTVTGRHGWFATYEAFAMVSASQTIQHSK
jgi:xylulose-5-phosphate/fructose-6-phosphate phosphoketolase